MNTTLFRQSRTSNQYDALAVDVDTIYRQFPIESKQLDNDPAKRHQHYFSRLYQASWLPVKTRRYLWELFHRSNLDQGWFESFRVYWTDVLSGRPLWGVHDFYFLRGSYRVKFQDNQIPETDDSSSHLAAWQQPELLYQLLHLVYRESLEPSLQPIQLAEQYARPGWQSMLEFGCATAPITASLFEFDRRASQKQIYIADIKTIAFHYGSYRFRSEAKVVPLLLRADDGFKLELPQAVDIMYCITVFEHLPHPLATVQSFWSQLQEGGLLVFDYIMSDGGGLDTVQAQRERAAVLDFIEQHFDVVHGKIDRDRSMPVTVARKRTVRDR